MRFTTKIEDGSYMGTTHNPDTSIETDIQNCVQKLGQLEDIEEELGIDLVTLFKALSGTYAVREDNGSITEEWSCPRFYAPAVFGYGFNGWISIRPRDEEKQLYLKDYGKTWALTKEELL